MSRNHVIPAEAGIRCRSLKVARVQACLHALAGIILHALERIGAHARETVFVGDNWDNDVAGALSAGMAAVWLHRDQTPALARLSEQKWLESLANAGVSYFGVTRITSLLPAAEAIAAIKTAFKYRTPGAQQHEQLETLAS